MEPGRSRRNLSSEDIRQTRRITLDMGLDLATKIREGSLDDRKVQLEKVVTEKLDKPANPSRTKPLVERVKTIFKHH